LNLIIVEAFFRHPEMPVSGPTVVLSGHLAGVTAVASGARREQKRKAV
jgi:hypothetical protein